MDDRRAADLLFLEGRPLPMELYIYILYIYIPEKGGRKPAAARRVSLFLAGVAAEDTWSEACGSVVPRMRGGVCNGDGGNKEASRAALG